MRHSIRRIHFIGVGGAGMAGLAEVMAGMGYAVSGSDFREQPALARLRARGVSVFVGHDAGHVAEADCAVYSSAVAVDNVERVAAVQRGIPVVPRAQMLGELMRFKPGIAVAGTHGKTTVSSMIAHVLTTAELSPTCVIGGRLLSLRDGGLIGSGEYVVVEADESDASFLHLQPVLSVVTNIDDDHLEAFGDDFGVLSDAFVSFLGNLPFYGTAVVCNDDAAAAAVADRVESRRVVRYGLTAGADVTAVDITADGATMRYTLVAAGGRFPMTLAALGRHNVQNALAATAVALEVGVEVSVIGQALQTFAGVGRRQEFYGEVVVGGARALLVDDYAHHPSEISATLAALAAAYPQRRLRLVFQPHRYSRTQRLMDELAQSMAAADALLLLPVYAAGETAPEDDLLAVLCDKVRAQGVAVQCCDALADVPARLEETLVDGDLLVCMGAGDIGTLPAMIARGADG